jgi:hypothetical protein
LRADPQPEQVLKFQHELFCTRLEAQVQRLLESVSNDPQQQRTTNAGAPPQASQQTPQGQTQAPTQGQAQGQPQGQPQVQAQGMPLLTEELCARDAARLSRLRADPTAEGIRQFERDLSCEHIRPQLQRLRESLGL